MTKNTIETIQQDTGYLLWMLFVNVVACCAVSNPAWCRISQKYHVFFLSILGHCFDVVFLSKALNPQMLYLTQVKMSTWYDRDRNVYDKFNKCAKMAAGR